MILGFHITIALLSLITSFSLLFSFSRSRRVVAYSMIGGTLTSGIALILTTPEVLAHACASGLLFSVVSLTLVHISKRKYASEIIKK